MIIFLLIPVCAIMLLCSCKKGNVLDGPDMAYEPKWTEFSISQSGTVAEDIFYFTVTDNGEESMVTGSCRGEYGIYDTGRDGIIVPAETMWELRRLDLEKLKTVIAADEGDTITIDGEELILPEILDGYSEELTVTLPTSEVVKKVVPDGLPNKIYEILIPLFDEEYK